MLLPTLSFLPPHNHHHLPHLPPSSLTHPSKLFDVCLQIEVSLHVSIQMFFSTRQPRLALPFTPQPALLLGHPTPLLLSPPFFLSEGLALFCDDSPSPTSCPTPIRASASELRRLLSPDNITTSRPVIVSYNYISPRANVMLCYMRVSSLLASTGKDRRDTGAAVAP